VSGVLRLAVRLPNWLGDCLLARPLLHALSAGLLSADLRAVGPAEMLPLLAADLPEFTFEPWPTDGAGRSALARKLREWGANVVLVLPPSFSSAWHARGWGASRRIGWLLTEALRRPVRGDRHVSEEFLELGARLGVVPVALPPLPVGPEARAAAVRLRAEAGLGDASYAVLGPGAAYGPAKRWPAERFAEVGERLRRRGLALVLAGAREDAAACAAVRERLGGGCADLSGRTDLAALAGLCAAARVVVCNDSGLGHLAAALGIPTVTVFGSTSSAWTAPLGSRVRVVQHAPPCSPCFRRTCAIGYRCLESVSPECVACACKELIG
jgi:heptosyltransferase-2